MRAADGGFVVESARAVYRARAVVVATGYSRVPNPERLPGQERFGGTLLHASSYRNGDPFAGQRVLVVGAGNTGAEIALDLAERGAKPTLAVRAPVNVVPRDFLGMPMQVTSIRMRHAPLALADGIGRLASRLAFGNLARLGFPRPALGPISAIKLRRRIPLIDVGTIAAVKRGEIAVKPGVARLTARGAVFADDSAAEFDAVVLATGFRAALDEFVAVPGVLDDRRLSARLARRRRVPEPLLRRLRDRADRPPARDRHPGRGGRRRDRRRGARPRLTSQRSPSLAPAAASWSTGCGWQLQWIPSMSHPSRPQALPEATTPSVAPTASSRLLDRSPGLSAEPRQWTDQESAQTTGSAQVLCSSNRSPSFPTRD